MFIRHKIAGLILSLSISPVVLANKFPHIDVSAWLTYERNLKTCTPGNFILPNPFQVKVLIESFENEKAQGKPCSLTQSQLNDLIIKSALTYKILGHKDNKCHVILKPSEALGIECFFVKSDLPILMNNAKEISHNTFDINKIDELVKVMASSCKPQSIKKEANPEKTHTQTQTKEQPLNIDLIDID
ncbi:MAG: hypothetical protein JWM09_113 [Francisellaceae bacterium]|nr:hypothetical protein [Francisellaceae bacterium]